MSGAETREGFSPPDAAQSPETTQSPYELTFVRKLLYSVGYFGVSVFQGLFMLWIYHEYEQRFTGSHTLLIGAALVVGRVLDGAADPLCGWWSDRTRTRMGRRRPFIAFGTAPLVLSFALVWFPPGGQNNPWTAVWLFVTAVAFFTLFSIVVNPYLAMLPDIARTNQDRVSTAALQAAFGLAATASAMVGGSVLIDRIGLGRTVLLVCSVAFVCLMLPLAVRETSGKTAEEIPTFGVWRAITETLANRPFRIFLVSKCLYWLAVNLVLAAMGGFVGRVLGVPEDKVHSETGLLMGWAVGSALVFFLLMKHLARLLSKRQLSLAGLLCLAACLAAMAVAGLLPLNTMLYMRIVLLTAGFAVAVIFAIPNAILADLVDLDERTCGKRREAMYYGAQGFFVKASWGGAMGVLAASDALFGEGAAAVRAAWVFVSVAAAFAFFFFLRFPEDQVLARLQDSKASLPPPRG